MIFQGIITRVRHDGKCVADLVDEAGKLSEGGFPSHELENAGILSEVGQRFGYEMIVIEHLWPEPRPPWWKRLTQIIPGRRR